jgi:hypothetical protein
MSTEKRPGTQQTYVTKVRRVDGRLLKRYIGPSADPVVSLLTADHQLALADQRASRQQNQAEIELDKKMAASFDRIVDWSKNWKFIYRLTRLPQAKDMRTNKPDTTPSKLPTLHRFTQTCRLANEGDQDAISQLDHWIAEIPGLLSEATNLVRIAESQLVDFLAQGSPETEAIVRRHIAQTSADLQLLVKGDSLAKLHADALTMVWMDMMRCQLGAMRLFEDSKTAKYWDAAADRATRRWGRVEKSFGQYRKQANREST